MYDRLDGQAERVRESALLIARARANIQRSRDLIARSLGLLTHGLEGFARNADPESVSAPSRATAVPATRLPPRSGAVAENDDPGLTIATAVALSGLDSGSLWLAYVSIGGDHSSQQVQAFLQGESLLPAHDTRILAHVINEHFRQQGIFNPVSED